MQKPEADYIKGISPAIAIEQKVNTHNPRSTVGTSSEIYEYLKLLFARIGKTYSPISGQEVKQHSVTDVVDFIESIPEGIPVIIGSEIEQNTGRNLSDQLQILRQQGFTRLFQNGKIIKLDDLLNQIQAVGDLTCEKSIHKTQDLPPQLQIVIDRLTVDANDKDQRSRLADSVQSAFLKDMGNALCIYLMQINMKRKCFPTVSKQMGLSLKSPLRTSLALIILMEPVEHVKVLGM